eukprot:gene15469-biopygen8167
MPPALSNDGLRGPSSAFSSARLGGTGGLSGPYDSVRGTRGGGDHLPTFSSSDCSPPLSRKDAHSCTRCLARKTAEGASVSSDPIVWGTYASVPPSAGQDSAAQHAANPVKLPCG